MEIQRTIPVDVAHLLPVLDHMLIDLLNNLRESDWQQHTVARRRTVKDVAGHLLDGNIRLLSILRDGHAGEPYSAETYADLVAFLDRLNADWLRAMKRVSPQMLILMLESTGTPFCEYMQSLKPFGRAHVPVDWAGENDSLNWMAVAREYSEKWLHQQQIRDAVGKPGLMTRELFHPFMEIFMCALPHTYRKVFAAEGTTVQVRVTTEVGGSWAIRRTIGRWRPVTTPVDVPDASIELDPDTAWKLFSKSSRPEYLIDSVTITGDPGLAEVALGMAAVSREA